MGTILKGEVASSFLYQLLPVYSIYNALLGPFLFLVLDKTNRWLQLKKSNSYVGMTR